MRTVRCSSPATSCTNRIREDYGGCDPNEFSFAGLDAFSLRTTEDHDDDFGPRLRSMLAQGSVDWSDLPRENDSGYIEYKWRLGLEHDSPLRAQRLATQMRFRLGEGGGTAFYLLGVLDSGSAAGLAPDEHMAAVRVLMGVAAVMGSVLLLEAMSEDSRGKRCSAWRVESKNTALQQVADLLHPGSSAFLPEMGQKPPVQEKAAPADVLFAANRPVAPLAA